MNHTLRLCLVFCAETIAVWLEIMQSGRNNVDENGNDYGIAFLRLISSADEQLSNIRYSDVRRILDDH